MKERVGKEEFMIRNLLVGDKSIKKTAIDIGWILAEYTLHYL
jgi:hypothetical protein